MTIGTFVIVRNFLHTSNPDNPGSITSSKTKSAPCCSNFETASFPLSAVITSYPSFESMKDKPSLKDSSSSTKSIFVMN